MGNCSKCKNYDYMYGTPPDGFVPTSLPTPAKKESILGDHSVCCHAGHTKELVEWYYNNCQKPVNQVDNIECDDFTPYEIDVMMQQIIDLGNKILEDRKKETE